MTKTEKQDENIPTNEALAGILEVLRPLNDEQRTRLLHSMAELYGLPLTRTAK